MKVTEISVSTTAKINVSPYNNLDFHVGVKAEIEDGDEPLQVVRSLFAALKAQLILEVEALPGEKVQNWLSAVKPVAVLPLPEELVEKPFQKREDDLF